MAKRFYTKLFLILITMSLILPIPRIDAKETEANQNQERMRLFKNMENLYQIPWYYIAAINQYEKNIQPVRQDLPIKKGLISIYFGKSQWAGFLNPNPDDQNPGTIRFFHGIGVDGNGDGKADRDNDVDALVTFLTLLSRFGTTEEQLKLWLTQYYHSEQTAKIIIEIAKIYRHFNTLDVTDRVFPIPKWNNYSYRSTWGDRRGWGGLRIHEGTDIFASYGTPVRSVSYGYVEILGWNKYGGWRVGIRDVNNIYYYYAHLTGFKKGLKEGDIVKPGDIIGYVGSSGYGPKGTQGKFPPHLHFGMYKYNGRTEWAFDPTPYLRAWERKMKTKK
ncbi:M23 family metallopeptidase [Tepidibacillus sp. LV47]|uniref:M23 family metallopeptidase n=1 Tax=Tepidibacillus sp. LV47 TaxID=3398228 RepID=UPI003AB0DC20